MRYELDLLDASFIYDQGSMDSHEHLGVEIFLQLMNPNVQ
jgi:hypothetical protein